MGNNRNRSTLQAGILVSLFCLFILPSCVDKDPVVASVGDRELRQSEAYLIMEYLDIDVKSDSAYTAFLNDWVNEQVFSVELAHSKPDTFKLMRLRSEGYLAEMSRFVIEESWFESMLDTVIREQEVSDFYSMHKDEFILHDYIVKALYLKIPASVDYKEKNIHTKFLLKNDKDRKDINSYAKLYAENYYFNDSGWIFFNELAKDIPLQKYNIDNIVLNRTKTYFSDEEHTYFLNIIDYKLKDEAPPLDFLRNQIREIILNARMQELKEKKAMNLLKELKKKHEIYINP